MIIYIRLIFPSIKFPNSFPIIKKGLIKLKGVLTLIIIKHRKTKILQIELIVEAYRFLKYVILYPTNATGIVIKIEKKKKNINSM